MEEKNKTYLVILVFAILIIWGLAGTYDRYKENKNWKEVWTCEKTSAVEPERFIEGGELHNCDLDCVDAGIRMNTEFYSCTCSRNNKTYSAELYCEQKLLKRVFNKEVLE